MKIYIVMRSENGTFKEYDVSTKMCDAKYKAQYFRDYLHVDSAIDELDTDTNQRKRISTFDLHIQKIEKVTFCEVCGKEIKYGEALYCFDYVQHTSDDDMITPMRTCSFECSKLWLEQQIRCIRQTDNEYPFLGEFEKKYLEE